MTENTEMSIRDAFIALDQMDDDDIVVSTPVRKRSRRVNEGKAFNVRSTTEMEEADEFLNKPKKEVSLEVIDADADAVEHLKDNKEYVGQMILQCNSCKATRFLDADDLVESEADSEIYNVEDECPHCHNSGTGYHLVGQVGAVDEKEENEPSIDNDSLTAGEGEEEVKFDNDMKSEEEETSQEETEEESGNESEDTESTEEETEETEEETNSNEESEEEEDSLDSELQRIEMEDEEEEKKKEKKESLEESTADETITGLVNTISNLVKQVNLPGNVSVTSKEDKGILGKTSYSILVTISNIDVKGDVRLTIKTIQSGIIALYTLIKNKFGMYSKFLEIGEPKKEKASADDEVVVSFKVNIKAKDLKESDEEEEVVDPETTEEIPEEEEEPIITLKDFVESKFVDPENLTDVVVIDLDTQDEPIFTGEYSEIPQKVLESEIVGFNVGDGKLNIRASQDETEETPKLDCLQFIINDLFDDNDNDQVSIVDAESDDEIVSGTKADVFEKIEGYTCDLMEIPDRLVITIRSSEEEPDYLSTVDEVPSNEEPTDEESLITEVLKENNMSSYKVNKYGTDEYWLAESIRSGEDLDIIYERYIKDTNSKLIKEFKSVTGYKTKLDEVLEDELTESDNCISEQDAINKANKALKDRPELKAVIYGFTNGGKFNCLEKGEIMEIETDRELDMANELVDRKYHPSGTVRVLYRRNVKESLNNRQVKNFKNRKDLGEAIKACQNNNQPYTVKRSLKEGYRYELTTLNEGETLYDKVKQFSDELKQKPLNESPILGDTPFDDDDDDGFRSVPQSAGDVDAGTDLSTEVRPEVNIHDVFDPRDRELVDKLMRIATDTKEAIEATYNVQADERFILADIIQDLRLVSGDLTPEDIERTPLNELTLEMYDAYEGFYNELDELASALTGREVRTSRLDKITQAVESLDGPDFATETIWERIQSPDFERALTGHAVPGVQLPNGPVQRLIAAPQEPYDVDYDEEDYDDGDDLDESLNEASVDPKSLPSNDKDTLLKKVVKVLSDAGINTYTLGLTLEQGGINYDSEKVQKLKDVLFEMYKDGKEPDVDTVMGVIKESTQVTSGSQQLNLLAKQLDQELEKKGYELKTFTHDKYPGSIIINVKDTETRDKLSKDAVEILKNIGFNPEKTENVDGKDGAFVIFGDIAPLETVEEK